MKPQKIRHLAKARAQHEAELMAAIEKEALNNPRIAAFKELPPYYLSFGSRAKLVAILPVADASHPAFEKFHYYASRKTNDEKVAAAFVWDDSHLKEHESRFMFCSEGASLEAVEKAKANPVVLMFKGCDDGHAGRRFKTVQEAMDYIDCMVCFEDIFEDADKEFAN